MGQMYSDRDDPIHMLAKEWAAGHRKFVCTMCRKKTYLLRLVMAVIGDEQGKILQHMWQHDNLHSPHIPSEEEIYEVHNLSKEWHEGHKKFVLSLCMRKPDLFNLLMDFLDEKGSQDLLHCWLVDHLQLGGDLPKPTS